MKFDKVVSLGNTCQTAYQIRRLLPQQQEAYFFDWLISPHAALIATLKEGFSGFQKQKNLVLLSTLSNPIILDELYGFEFHHDFHSTNWRLSLNDVNQKYMALAERWRRLMTSGANILFIRQDALGDIPIGHIEEINKTLAQLNIAGNYKTVYLHFNRGKEPEINENPQFERISLPQPDPWEWKGSDGDWDALASRLGVL